MRSVGLSVSGAVAPSAPAGEPAGLSRRGHLTEPESARIDAMSTEPQQFFTARSALAFARDFPGRFRFAIVEADIDRIVVVSLFVNIGHGNWLGDQREGR